jgi:hypothetical protein
MATETMAVAAIEEHHKDAEIAVRFAGRVLAPQFHGLSKTWGRDVSFRHDERR